MTKKEMNDLKINDEIFYINAEYKITKKKIISTPNIDEFNQYFIVEDIFGLRYSQSKRFMLKCSTESTIKQDFKTVAKNDIDRFIKELENISKQSKIINKELLKYKVNKMLNSKEYKELLEERANLTKYKNKVSYSMRLLNESIKEQQLQI